MKKMLIRGVVLGVAVTGLLQLNAQSKYRTGGTTTKPSTVKQEQAPAQATPAGDTVIKRTSNNTASAGAVTVTYDTTIQGGFDQKPEISLRNNYAMVRNLVRDRKPLEYEDLREDDAHFSHFVWREIDGREKINQSFVYPGKEDM
jgi:hypothetical protein